jgi:hypothetical protein
MNRVLLKSAGFYGKKGVKAVLVEQGKLQLCSPLLIRCRGLPGTGSGELLGLSGFCRYAYS